MKFFVSCPLLNRPRRNRSSSWANRTSPAQYPHGRLARLSGTERPPFGATILLDHEQMKKPSKRRRLPFTTRPKKKYSFPVPIPPCSVVSVKRGAGKPWTSKAGRIFRIGYYSKIDGLDCVWLVDETGSYDQTVDHECLGKFFEIQSIAEERSLYGRGRPPFFPLVR
jgi:hypothetical protein